MLTNTFIHIPGIGPATEKKIWNSGTPSWESEPDFAQAPVSLAKKDELRVWTKRSLDQLNDSNPIFFQDLLPAHQHFRMYKEFRGQCVFLDIETTGLDESAVITTIAIYDGKKIEYFIQGRNLSDFLDAIYDYKIIVTYNGKCFDIPFIENYFNIRLPHAQIDLRYVLAHLGFKGGLKKCEKAMGIDRAELDGIDGYFAVLLWKEFKQTGNEKALETLLAYNIEDVINLESLMVKSYNLNINGTCFNASHKLKEPEKPENPFIPDQRTVQSIISRFY